MRATTHQGNRPTRHQEEHEVTTMTETAQAELTKARAALHELIDKASLPALRWLALTSRVAVLTYDTPGGKEILRREHEDWLLRHPLPDKSARNVSSRAIDTKPKGKTPAARKGG